MSLQDIRLADLTGTIIASVVPDTLFNLKRLCEKHVPGEVRVIGDPSVDLGIEVMIDRPEQVGADRLVGVVAAHAKYGGPVMVLDFGTATSFDVADAEGNFRGGVLAPGVRLSVEALYMAAAKLPRIEIKPPETVIGRATIPAMESGVYWGYVSMIEGMIGRIQAEYGEPMKVVATGGLSALFADATDRIDITDQNLMMDGLIEIHRRNT